MGRASGFLAVEVGIAGGAEFIIIPEFPVTPQQIVEKLRQKKRQKLASIIINAEADRPGHSIELAKREGISGIIQPGGSIKDQEVISKANELDMIMVMTGIRHFYH